ncbi:MAG: alpha/beta fold hydrolase [Myxococcales bacterium]|nr:alpha/beta fold hydrolase [Myxococcales bacterium]MCB9625768.1 alpha/beta fold hydrolase [Sandaracinaceae bacterium]
MPTSPSGPAASDAPTGSLSFSDRFGMGAQNALELLRVGRFADPEHAPFRVLHSDRVYKLRRYGDDQHQPRLSAPILLVPPLMVTSEVYDIAPDISSVRALLRSGLDVWLVDFGAPEREEGGMDRTLDDHIGAVSDAIDRVVAATGEQVHLAGYSQGGMFCYQTAALRRSAGIKSLITFGSPVDIYRNLPGLNDALAGPLISAAAKAIQEPLDRIAGLPGFLTSTGFKLLSVRKEASQVVDFVQKLHDRAALEKRESRRRFLGGEGFVAWPGPALRDFVDQFIVHNRMTSGGFILDGRTVSLADITVPVLAFIGTRDAIAQPPAVRAIRRAAPNAEVHEVSIKAGHFGIVVGSRALSQTWPTVVDWMFWKEGKGGRPQRLSQQDARLEGDDAPFDDIQFDIELFYDAFTRRVGTAMSRASDSAESFTRWISTLRYQVPRIQTLRAIEASSLVSLGRTLAEQRREMPDATFFLWEGRAFSYAEADRRVDNVVRGLIACGVRPGERVAVLMDGRPSYLSVVTALSRLGAVAVLLSPDERRVSVARALSRVEVQYVVCDPENTAQAKAALPAGRSARRVLVLGGGGEQRKLDPDVIDMEAIDPVAVAIPEWYRPNPGRASDLGMIIFTAGAGEEPRAARITNRRWAFSAYGAAAAASLTPKDTVYSCLPLHHAAGMLVTVGGALVGGARLALGAPFSASTFWPEVRRYGASVVFYAGEMVSELLEAPPSAVDNNIPVRLFAGSGMRAHHWRSLRDRFGDVHVLEFYASTEGNCVLANTLGRKVGAVGRPLPGSAEVALVRYDFDAGEPFEDERGFLIPAGAGQLGVLLARVDGDQPMSAFDGYVEKGESERRLRKGVFEQGDTWFVTRDIMRRDEDGDFWFVDRAVDVLHREAGDVASRSIEDALYGFDGIRRVVVVGHRTGKYDEATAVIVPRDAGAFDLDALSAFVRRLPELERPERVRLVDDIPLTDGYRPLKSPLRSEDEQTVPAHVWDAATQRYV